MPEKTHEVQLFTFSDGLRDISDPFAESNKNAIYDGGNFRIKNGVLMTDDSHMQDIVTKGSLFSFLSSGSVLTLDTGVSGLVSGSNCVFQIKTSGIDVDTSGFGAYVHTDNPLRDVYARAFVAHAALISGCTNGWIPNHLTWSNTSSIYSEWMPLSFNPLWVNFYLGVSNPTFQECNITLKQYDILGLEFTGASGDIYLGSTIHLGYYGLASGQTQTAYGTDFTDPVANINPDRTLDCMSPLYVTSPAGLSDGDLKPHRLYKSIGGAENKKIFPAFSYWLPIITTARTDSYTPINQVVPWSVDDERYTAIVADKNIMLFDNYKTTKSFVSTRAQLLFASTDVDRSKPCFVTPVNMNDRNALLIGGESTQPYWGFISHTSFVDRFNNIQYKQMSLFSSAMPTYFLNGTVSNASGLHDGYIYPKFLIEFKNKIHMCAPSITYSDASGPHTELYPRSIFPSQGYTPNIYDWNEEILVDTPENLITALIFKDNLVCFTAHSVFSFTYDSDGVPTTPIYISGAPGAKSVTSVCTDGAYIYWFDNQGAYMSDGLQWVKLSSAIDDSWSSKFRIDMQYGKYFSVYDPHTQTVSFSWSGTYKTNTLSDIRYTFVYHVPTKTWSCSNIDLAGVLELNDSQIILSTRGGMRRRTLNYAYLDKGFQASNSAYWEGKYNASLSHEIPYLYGVQPDTQVSKLCGLVPDYAFKANAVYTKFLVKSNWAASQSFTIQAYWDGNKDLNNLYSGVCYIDQQSNVSVPLIKPYKFFIPGSGNVLHLDISRSNQGDVPLEIINVQVEYDIVERGDV